MDWFIRVVQGKFIGPKAEYQIDKKKESGLTSGLFHSASVSRVAFLVVVGNSELLE